MALVTIGRVSLSPRASCALWRAIEIYSFRIVYLLGAQFAAIPILFLMGPVWLFASFITVVDVVVRLIPSVESSGPPILCQFVELDRPYCLPALVAYHAAMALLAFAVARYGERLLNAAAGGYRRGVEWLEGQVRYRSRPPAPLAPAPQKF